MLCMHTFRRGRACRYRQSSDRRRVDRRRQTVRGTALWFGSGLVYVRSFHAVWYASTYGDVKTPMAQRPANFELARPGWRGLADVLGSPSRASQAQMNQSIIQLPARPGVAGQ